MMVDNGMRKDRLTTKVERLEIAIKYCLKERLDIHVSVKEFNGVLDRISLWQKIFIKDKRPSQIEVNNFFYSTSLNSFFQDVLVGGGYNNSDTDISHLDTYIFAIQKLAETITCSQ